MLDDIGAIMLIDGDLVFDTGEPAGQSNSQFVYMTIARSAATFADADFDQDGDVDGDDFLAWQGGFGTTSGAMKSDGDYDNDGDVDGDDFLGWQSEFGSGGGSGAVPEPTSIVMLLLLAVGVAAKRFAKSR